MCALTANAGAALHGKIMGLSYSEAQKVYYSKVRFANRVKLQVADFVI